MVSSQFSHLEEFMNVQQLYKIESLNLEDKISSDNQHFYFKKIGGLLK
jgi:hypothetical protein